VRETYCQSFSSNLSILLSPFFCLSSSVFAGYYHRARFRQENGDRRIKCFERWLPPVLSKNGVKAEGLKLGSLPLLSRSDEGLDAQTNENNAKSTRDPD